MYIIVGLVFLGIGTLGIVLPLLPSIPFLFIASVCFVRGSERLDRWFKGTTLYQKHLLGFLKNKEMTLVQKIWINLVADTAIIMSIVIVDYMWIRIILVLAAIYKHYYFIFKIKTVKAVH
ncbi:YbaN family protein [Radiobacillus sp. PE A8.2]|uniref:YbaN family protein n=1 Tax=Radiobacillus sp. PE A8.2 TaxID=3380349 RepID=UPI00388E9BA9